MSNEIENKLDAIEKNLLKTIADIEKTPIGAYNIRENGKGVARNTTANIDIVTKQDKPGIDIIIKPIINNRNNINMFSSFWLLKASSIIVIKL